jgi:hypothetical protein
MIMVLITFTTLIFKSTSLQSCFNTLRFFHRKHWLQSRPKMDLRKAATAMIKGSRYVPKASQCLIQALCTHHFLAREYPEIKIVIGAQKNKHRDFEAHAWVELEASIVIGQRDPMPKPLQALSYEK